MNIPSFHIEAAIILLDDFTIYVVDGNDAFCPIFKIAFLIRDIPAAYRGGGFLLNNPSGLSINRLSPCAPRF